MSEQIKWLHQCGRDQVAEVGGKNAQLGEMINHLSASGVRVPGGFATTAAAFESFLRYNALTPLIDSQLDGLDTNDVTALARAGAAIRQAVLEASLPDDLAQAIAAYYKQMCDEAGHTLRVAVRSSATAEDLPDASFAGQQETFLNIAGEDAILTSVKRVFASLYTDRAIAYREHQGFKHQDVAISVGVQQMVQSDQAASGVMFTIDTESGFEDVVLITASYGLGECLVQGAVNPDEFVVYKPNVTAKREAIVNRKLGTKLIKMVNGDQRDPASSVKTVEVEPAARLRFCLSDEEVTELARYAIAIERHYGCPMDIEWGKDGPSGRLMILQARPETVKSRESSTVLESFKLRQAGARLVEGCAIGSKIGQGAVRCLQSIEDMDHLKAGDVLVTDMTDPDWEPIMKRASAIVTNRGGRTCHAAIIARELGIPAVVGCGNATEVLAHVQSVTVSCAEGDVGVIYEGELDYSVEQLKVDTVPELPLKVMMNIGNPSQAFLAQRLPNQGVGLARLEFIINHNIGVHPKALMGHEDLPMDVAKLVAERTSAYASPESFFVRRLSEGVATLACAFYPKPIIVRLSDFKSNEYANLIGGELFEPVEENPMLGFRGAARYLDPFFQPCFLLELEAIKRAREQMGFDNIQLMVPFVRTPAEGKQVIQLLAEAGLHRGQGGLQVMMMCELPANCLLAEEFLQDFDGFSIGSNDLTQLTLGLDRDSSLVAGQFDERNKAVKQLISRAIAACREQGKYIGICGQGPSDHPDFARWLLDERIASISLNPDTVVGTTLALAQMTAA